MCFFALDKKHYEFFIIENDIEVNFKPLAGGRVSPKLTMDNPLLYVASVYEAFPDEKFDEFLELARDATANRNDVNARNRMTELMKGHQNLLQGLTVFLPNANTTFPREAEQLGMSKAKTFLNNVEKRFETVDSHVYDSVVRKLVSHKAGKKSFKKMREEILDLLYYHEDLTEEFTRIVPPRP